MSEFLFVYGTLRRGGANHACLATSPFVGAATTVPPCALYVDDYPYLNPDVPTGPVVGEVYEVTPELLLRLDAFEGVPILYQRARLAVDVGGSGRVDAWVYIRADDTGALVEDGDFLQNDCQPSVE